MLTQSKELFAPSLHYQQAITAEVRRMPKPVEGDPMAPEVRDHLEAMLLQASKETERQPCNLLLQYASGFIGHAVFTKDCTIAERLHYWGEIDRIRQRVADRNYSERGVR
jgi:hypothetical protein